MIPTRYWPAIWHCNSTIAHIREEFAKCIDDGVIGLESLLFSYGPQTLGAIRATEPKISDYITDMTTIKDTPFRAIRLVPELVVTFSALHRNKGQSPQIEEIAIPSRLAKYAIDLTGSGGRARPDRNMTSEIRHRFGDVKAKYPSYGPYIVPDLATGPWRPANPEYRELATGWGSKMRVGNFPKPRPLHVWLLARLMFLFTSDIW